MAKKYTQADMERFELMLEKQEQVNEEQGNLLKEILLCLKGSEALNMEGVIPAQRRIEKALLEIKEWKTELHAWRTELNVYLAILTSKKIWRFVVFIITGIAISILIIRFGFWTVWDYLKKLVGL